MSFLALGLGSLQVVLDRGQIDDWFGSHFITTFFAVSCVALIAFVWWELRQEHPVVDLRVLKNGNFALSVIAMLVMGLSLLCGDLSDSALRPDDAGLDCHHRGGFAFRRPL